MADYKEGAACISDEQLVRTLHWDITALERSICAAEDKIEETNPNRNAKRFGIISLCCLMIMLAEGRSTMHSDADFIFEFLLFGGFAFLVYWVLELRDSSIESSKREAMLASRAELLKRLQGIRSSAKETCSLMERAESGEALHGVCRARLEGLLEEVRSIQELLNQEVE